MEGEDIQGWKCVYPLYFDVNRSVRAGRRLPKPMCIANPSGQHLLLACQSLDLPVKLEVLMQLQSLVLPLNYQDTKRHPREPFLMGRLRVQIKDEKGAFIKSDIRNTQNLLHFIGQRLPQVAATAKITPNPLLPKSSTGGAVGEGVKSPTSVTTGALPGVTLVPRGKKKKNKN